MQDRLYNFKDDYEDNEDLDDFSTLFPNADREEIEEELQSFAERIAREL